ncbi:YhbY family RNA-binding protein [Candidatus Woesearchaeota archaeon]|nr:YhbY family RNA-binding protein [Candidatus Woesearchaeota archaeon]
MISKIRLRSKAKTLEPIVRIGKNGLTEGTINEIKRQLKKKKLIKIKLLKSFVQARDKKELIKEIASLTNSEIIESVGFILVLHKK